MTREEAKEILTHNWTRVDNPNYSESELDEAFFMAIEALSAEVVHKPDYSYEADMVRRLKESLSANAEHGVWEHIESPLEDNIFKCSKCGNPLKIPTVDGEPIYNYCVHCGAKMDNVWGEKND